MESTGIRRVRWAFPPATSAPTLARRRLNGQLDEWGIGAEEAEPVLLVAHELVANAVDHARTRFELAVSFDGTAVVVDVHDESPLQPRLRPLNLAAARGRGLQMVAALARTWCCIRRTGGKTVRAVIVPFLSAGALLDRGARSGAVGVGTP